MEDEIELKLNINCKDASRLRKHLAIMNASISRPSTNKLVNFYFDTPELKLLDAGISLRLRRMSGCWTQLIKTVGNPLAGLHKRTEWESPVLTGHPDFTKIIHPNLIKLFTDKKQRDALRPIFKTEVQRSIWQLSFDNGDQVELALDIGKLEAGEYHELICEVALELKSGNIGRLFDIGLELQTIIPLTINNSSKAERGYAYYRFDAPSAIKAQLPILSKNTDGYSAFKQIISECINHLQHNQGLVLNAADIEGLHQMRVALRRMRSAFTMFKKIVCSKKSVAIIAELKWINETLGKARDIDVFVTQTLPAIIEKSEDNAGLLKLREKALTAQLKASKEVKTAISSQRYHRFLLTLLAWLENERWCANIKHRKNYQILDIAKATLKKYHKLLLRQADNLVYMDSAERHLVRIAAKKMRYAAEFFASLYPARKSHEFINNLSKLQDQLGVLNDISITEKLLRKVISHEIDPALEKASHILNKWNARNVAHNLAHVDKTWHAFTLKEPFWH
ncbi:MAG: CHAD domain-containing protein [Methylotenera sp.]|nr:CHAD domain-containing protein [Methylotenera sp.]MDO9232440.1 CHAD domain-containing protein [Methylotenera sp.]MDO9389960.1 CHAD domain-containing protein [Methylotenera sp.]MDP2403424.1 CHAD domain-containing protein [Methylotenera sp.]MDP3095602.1 CHAD domain-containing protein [Methylotenera sp.]